MTGVMDLTPAMRQYLEIKERHPDCILFFRMGDFYEMFFDDAVVASQVLEITLTSRNKGKEGSIPLCGIPYHAVSTYLAKLIDRGFKVAICEQMEDPRLAKGVVKREVTRIVTPGLVVQDDNLQAKQNNFLAALNLDSAKGLFGLAFLDISTGEFHLLESSDKPFFFAEINGLDIRELMVEESLQDSAIIKALSRSENPFRIDYFPPSYFELQSAWEKIRVFFTDDHLKQLGLESHHAAVCAAGAILRYVEETQKDRLGHINRLQWHGKDRYLILDESAKRNLELFVTINENKKTGSLFSVIDETVTAMGGRRLRWWLHYPLRIPEEIKERLAAVSELKEQHLNREALRKSLAQLYDIERLGSRIVMGVANGRDLRALQASLEKLPDILSVLACFEAGLICSNGNVMDAMPDICALIEKAIAIDPPMTLHEGGLIREGFDAQLDQLLAITRDGKRGIAALEEKERRRSGIQSLRVGYNSVFGYYIEVTKANADRVPDDYVRKQTLVNAERYINQELKEYEGLVLHAEDQKKEREYDLFIELRDRIAKEIQRIQRTASRIADLDALVSLAEVAAKYDYCCPFVDEEDIIEIKDGRHPVVERMPLPDGFVPNDIFIDLDKNRFLIITGPNMAGKSTYIRQIAHIVLLAQMGSFVPAVRARIGIVDRIFTRIGANDNLSRGQSTFMVEMNEVADILKNATARSLIVLDEVGRGTSTFDGLSIAWAVAEYIHDNDRLGARTLFATHYHQLTELAVTKEGVKNLNIAVKEWGSQIIFLRKIVAGGSNRSYGIHVARIAGIPNEVILRAQEILINMEKGEFDEAGMPKIARSKKGTVRNKKQLSLFMDDEDIVLQELRDIDILNLTPIDALNRIGHWKNKLNHS